MESDRMVQQESFVYASFEAFWVEKKLNLEKTLGTPTEVS